MSEFKKRAAFALLKRDGLVLCVERPDRPGVFGPPGGHVERWETEIGTAARELSEETALEARHIYHLHRCPGSKPGFELVTFRVAGWVGDEFAPYGPEGDRLAWLPLESLTDFMGAEWVREIEGLL